MRFASLLFVVLAACSSNPPPVAPTAPAPAATEAAPAPAPAAKDIKAPGEAKLGDTTKCPISGEEFVVAESSPHAEYNGKTYYFCCPDCAAKFKADPTKFVHGA